MVECNVLKFGSFTLKSGRQSPFFMNAGAYITGIQLKTLGRFYAEAIHENFDEEPDVFFGPAYKGIPLAVATAIAYSELYGKEIKYCSDRKEEKDHGADKGSFLGSKLKRIKRPRRRQRLSFRIQHKRRRQSNHNRRCHNFRKINRRSISKNQSAGRNSWKNQNYRRNRKP